MMSFDFLRIIALMPVRDFPRNTEAEKKNHKTFNYAYLVFSIIVIILLVVYKAGEVQSMSSLGDLLAWAIGAVIVLWAVGVLIQALQVLNYSNQTEEVVSIDESCDVPQAGEEEDDAKENRPKSPGRKPKPRIEEGEDPLIDETARMALDAYFDERYNLTVGDGYAIIKGLLAHKDIYLKQEYEQKSLAQWLYAAYSRHFKNIQPESMTTLTLSSRSKQNECLDQLKDYFEKIKKI